MKNRIRSLAKRARWERACRAAPLIRDSLEVANPRQLLSAVKISHANRYVLIANPKAGMSSLKAALIELETGRPAEAGRIHSATGSPFGRLNEVRADDPLRYMIDEGYLFFTTARDPYSRLVSGYRSKIVKPTRHKAGILDKLGLDPTDLNQPVTFADFARVVFDTPDLQRDPHWRSQANQTLAGIVPHHVVMRFESFSAGYEQLMDRIGVAAERRPSLQHRNESASSQQENLYTDELRRDFATHFAADFDTFGYPVDV